MGERKDAAWLLGGKNRLEDEVAGGLLIRITALHAAQDGEWIRIQAELCDEAKGLRERQIWKVRTELFGDLKLTKGEISAAVLEQIAAAAQLSEAVTRGISMLGYGANSARTLEQKLRMRGFSSEIAVNAVRMIAQKGYLREEHDACFAAQRYLEKGWGERRIFNELRHRGYGEEALASVKQQLEEIDFIARCEVVARKKSKHRPDTSADFQKLSAFLMRYGYEGAQIRQALRNAWVQDVENED